jgi:hypothetical protein
MPSGNRRRDGQDSEFVPLQRDNDYLPSRSTSESLFIMIVLLKPNAEHEHKLSPETNSDLERDSDRLAWPTKGNRLYETTTPHV